MSANVSIAPNLEVYNRPGVASRYAELTQISPCEALVMRRYIQTGAKVLELGVGGGRLTPILSSTASRYVGLDYAEEMIRRCRRKFPDLEFLVRDAADLSDFSDRSFDAVVFGYNGLDCLYPETKRVQCLRECRRVLRPDGTFIFSSHNARAILVRPAWNRKRAREFVSSLVHEKSAFHPVMLAFVTAAKAVQANARAISASGCRIAQRITTSAFWSGRGYFIDSSDGRVVTHHATREHISIELNRCGFSVAEIVGSDYPRSLSSFCTDWFYYVAFPRKMQEEVACG